MPFHDILKNLIHSLQKQKNHERVFPCTSLSASLTLESAVILPFFFLAMVTLILFMDVVRIQTKVTASLCESARELGMYAFASENHPEDSGVMECSGAMCILYGKAQVEKSLKRENLIGIVGGVGGISLLTSSYENQIVDLTAVYYYKSPIALFPFPVIRLESRGRVRSWTGYEPGTQGDSQGEADGMVYVTDSQSVYHTWEGCTYLSLSIKSVDADTIEALRNSYGAKYHKCDRCVTDKGNSSTYIITEKGDKFHSMRNCSGLKRSVYFVRKSSVEHLAVCHRCKSYDG